MFFTSNLWLQIKRYALVLLLLPLFFSCKTHSRKNAIASIFSATYIDDDAFARQLQSSFKTLDSNNRTNFSLTDNMHYTYQLNGYKPVWFTDEGIRKEVDSFLDQLDSLRWDGLSPDRYQVPALRKLYTLLKEDKNPDIATALQFDTLFTYNYLKASHDLLAGEILPKDADTLWFHPNDSSWNGPYVLADMSNSGKYISLNDYRSTLPTYAILRSEYRRYVGLQRDTELKSAIASIQQLSGDMPDSAEETATDIIIKAEAPWVSATTNDSISNAAQIILGYQDYTNLKLTGKLDSATIATLAQPLDSIERKLKANMERIRWLPRDFGNLYVLVNIPMMELFLRNNGQDAMHMRVVVGKPTRQTPVLAANMANIVINPPWGVPPTILKKDVLPGITRSGQKYLAKKGLKAYNRKGEVVNASDINANNYKRYVYRQKPGDDNALGYVKFNLPNPWDIYLHDTPHRGDFKKRYRALSSGCIRVQQPQQMAIYILSDLEKMKFDQDRLDSIIRTHKTRWEVLKNKIPVHVLYLTNFEDSTGTHIRFIQDIYKRDERLMSLLD